MLLPHCSGIVLYAVLSSEPHWPVITRWSVMRFHVDRQVSLLTHQVVDRDTFNSTYDQTTNNVTVDSAIAMRYCLWTPLICAYENKTCNAEFNFM